MARQKPESEPGRNRVSQTASEAQSISAALWRQYEAQPGFSDRLDAAEARLRAGGGALYEVRGNSLRKVRRGRG